LGVFSELISSGRIVTKTGLALIGELQTFASLVIKSVADPSMILSVY